MINARAEGLLESKMFKGPAQRQRCLVLADGFYEPKGPKAKTRPRHLFEQTSGFSQWAGSGPIAGLR